jgi:hypothetical protein
MRSYWLGLIASALLGGYFYLTATQYESAVRQTHQGLASTSVKRDQTSSRQGGSRSGGSTSDGISSSNSVAMSSPFAGRRIFLAANAYQQAALLESVR